MSISVISKQRKIFSFCKFLGRLDEKRAAATPWSINLAKIWSEHVVKIKLKVTKFGHHRVEVSDWQLWVWSSGLDRGKRGLAPRMFNWWPKIFNNQLHFMLFLLSQSFLLILTHRCCVLAHLIIQPLSWPSDDVPICPLQNISSHDYNSGTRGGYKKP